MAEQMSSINVDELRQAQTKLNEQADDSFSQYNSADQNLKPNVGVEGVALAGALGNFVDQQWDSDTKQLVEDYKKQANDLLQSALTNVGTTVQEHVAETESLYKN